MSASLTEGQVITMANGENITISLDPAATVNGATIAPADVDASNGVAHVIDAVLLPGFLGKTVVDVVVDEGFSTLATAVTEAGLIETLQTPGANFTVRLNASLAPMLDPGYLAFGANKSSRPLFLATLIHRCLLRQMRPLPPFPTTSSLSCFRMKERTH